MKPKPIGSMTPNKYLQTDEQALLEIAPHWKLMQVFPREPQRIGYDCGVMFYIGTESSTEPVRRIMAMREADKTLARHLRLPASTIVKPPAYRYGPALRLNVIATSNNPDAPNLSEWSTCVR